MRSSWLCAFFSAHKIEFNSVKLNLHEQSLIQFNLKAFLAQETMRDHIKLYYKILTSNIYFCLIVIMLLDFIKLLQAC